ncbi:WYL domain-containing protein [Glycomyces sp. L485]|uniref:helix-turn-helix transcriptional regulator n=1 Tax=Glycomyces sp. L485 TaxID=2909235 RepID=UPI001F4A5CD2|nr:WYL domain-containing protein [Glycomyces sp. L485]MCH7232242.1 WYL domain-containing protein [Glycomyces sp. L485]
MSDPTARALALLNLLQSHRHWSAPELAQRLEVTVRTVRRDVERLRNLGYRIDSAPGAHGGYRLEAGASLPPLLLSDEEAVTIAIGLRLVAAGRMRRGAEFALSVLAKLEQVLPSRLRRRVTALAPALQSTPGPGGVSTAVLTDLALACRDRERVRIGYRPEDRESEERRVEPHALVPIGADWYLVCWDLDRHDWRTFRVDRLANVEQLRVGFAPRALTPERVEDLVAVARTWGTRTDEAAAIVDLPIERFRAVFGEWARGATVEGPDRTRWPVGGADVRDIAYGLSWLPAGTGYRVELPEPERAELRVLLRGMLDALGR